jgi:glutathione synthase/RimK-type ligase-like ATP-grasp enzyme
MPLSCAILNSGSGAWAFEAHAVRLSKALWLDVRTTPADYVYLLGWDGPEPPACRRTFIPYESILLASDKRLLAAVFEERGVRTPRTYLLDTPAEVRRLAGAEQATEWVLKYPTGCGASGHRLLTAGVPLPQNWPVPYVVQEFVRLEAPEVYRLYASAGETFGWNVRRFPAGVKPSPWVAHARGARYVDAGSAPPDAVEQAQAALEATGLLSSFGCVDLLRDGRGCWLVLEVGTDGLFNHVDRDLGLPEMEREIDRRLAQAFWDPIGAPPWGSGGWRPRSI